MARINASLLAIALLAGVSGEGFADDVRNLAQRLVDENSVLVNAKDDASLAETFTEDATITLVCKDPDTGHYMVEVRDTGVNRWNIRQLYLDMHSGLLPENGPGKKIASKNIVEYASMIEPDLLVIHGYFQPWQDEAMRWPFIQVRRKHGDKWLTMSNRVFLNGHRAVLWSRIQVRNKTRK